MVFKISSTMRKRSYYIAMLFFVLSCGSTQPENTNSQSVAFADGESGTGETAALYNGTPIELIEESMGDKKCVVQQIQLQKEDLVFRMKKIPTELYVSKEMPGASSDVIDSAVADLNGEQVFYFELEETMRQDLLKKYHADHFDQAVSYLSFDISNDFMILTADGDTLTPSFTMYERNFHLAPYERVLIDFVGLDENEAFELVYRDHLFGKGEVRFQFPNQQFIDANLKDVL